MGAWIETDHKINAGKRWCYVAPLVGAWIETQDEQAIESTPVGRSPRGSVD